MKDVRKTDLLQNNKFKKLPGKKLQKRVLKTSRPLLIILLTPCHIGLLDKPGKNIGAHLHNLYPKQGAEACNVNVLIAVVDRIPHVTSNQWSISSPDLPKERSESTAESSSSPNVPNGGSEGMCVAYLDLVDAAPDLWSSRAMARERETMTIQQRCTISFAVREEGYPQLTQKLQLPVTNTLFLNGKTSTLLAQRWVRSPSKAHEKIEPFKLVDEKALPGQVVNFTSPRQFLHPMRKGGLWTSLTSITEPRTVAASVGNIVQKIHLGDNFEASPASQELETAIHQRIQDGETRSHHVDVWALIRPESAKDLSSINLREAILQGCQLRKVLSGGGGWGVKQGLLSLDPDAEYVSRLTEPQATDSIAMMGLNLGSRQVTGISEGKIRSKTIFENIINPGDTITFFVNKIPEEPVLESDLSKIDPNKYSQDLPYNLLQFGTVPSTIDAPPVTADNLPNIRAPRKAVLIKNCFGMLSGQGMSFEVSPS